MTTEIRRYPLWPWRPFFCLLPRRVDGVLYWLTTIEIRFVAVVRVGGRGGVQHHFHCEFRAPSKDATK